MVLRKWLKYQGVKIYDVLSQPSLETKEEEKFKPLFSALRTFHSEVYMSFF
jgi:hypothetical protein